MKNTPARLWIMPAKEAPIALVIRRKPHTTWRFYRWNLTSGSVTLRGERRGIFYPKGCDVSWDGRFWTFHGDFEDDGSGLAPLAALDPIAKWYSYGAWNGGGFFESPELLRIDVPTWDREVPKVLKPKELSVRFIRGGDESVEDARLRRDNWHFMSSSVQWQEPDPERPRLTMRLSWTKDHGERREYDLAGFPKLLDAGVFRATYDSAGHLLVARQGVLEQYTLDDIACGVPSFRFDLNDMDESTASRP